DERATAGFVVAGLILLGAIVAGGAPFAGRRLPHYRRPEVALAVDGVLPVAGVILTARAARLLGGPRPLLPLAILVLVGLSGIASAALAIQRGQRIGEVGHVEASLAFVILALPFAVTPIVGTLVVGIGAVVRAMPRIPLGDRSNQRG